MNNKGHNMTTNPSVIYYFVNWPDDILKIYHPYWRQFPELPYALHIAIGVFILLVAFVAIVGNSFVIFTFLRFRSLRTPGNLLVANLALSDLMLAITGFPLYAISSFYGRWAFSAEVCQLYGFLGATFGLMSINSLATIALDRYLVIVRTSLAARYIEWGHVTGMVALVWTNSVLWSMPPLFGWNRYILEGMGTTCSFDYITRSATYRSFILGMFFGGFVAPLLIIIVCYISIYITVRSHQRTFRNTDKMRVHKMSRSKMIHGKRQSSKYNQAIEYKTAKTALLAVLFYCIAWTPYAVVSLIGEFGNSSSLTPLTSTIPCIFAKMSTLYNPFLYSLVHPRFRQKVMLLLKGTEYPRRLRRQIASDSPRRISDFLRKEKTNSQSSFSSVEPRSPSKRDVPNCAQLRVNYARKLQHQTTNETSTADDDKEVVEISDAVTPETIQLVKVQSESLSEEEGDGSNQA